MDEERAEDAIRAFRSAEEAMKQLISNAGELVDSAASLRDTDRSVKSLAEALGIASKLWVEIATDLKGVAAEVQAAGKLLQQAEPRELKNAVNETTASVGALRAQSSALTESVTALDDQVKRLTSRVDSVAESTTSLREALIAKMDLHQASVAQVQSDLARLERDLEKRAKEADAAQLSARDQILKATRRNLYAASAAALFALVAVILVVVQ